MFILINTFVSCYYIIIGGCNCYCNTMLLHQSTEVSSPNAMELEGFIRCRRTLESHSLTVNSVTTDRHAGVSLYMKQSWDGVDHYYDTWHISKVNSLTKICHYLLVCLCTSVLVYYLLVISYLYYQACSQTGNFKQRILLYFSKAIHLCQLSCFFQYWEAGFDIDVLLFTVLLHL